MYTTQSVWTNGRPFSVLILSIYSFDCLELPKLTLFLKGNNQHNANQNDQQQNRGQLQVQTLPTSDGKLKARMEV